MALSDEQRVAIRARRLRDREKYRAGKLTEEQRQEIVQAYLDGAGVAYIARRFGVAPQTVSYHLNKASA